MNSKNIFTQRRKRIFWYLMLTAFIIAVSALGAFIGKAAYAAYSQVIPEPLITAIQPISDSPNVYVVFWKTHMQWAQESIKDRREFPFEEIQRAYDALVGSPSGFKAHMILDYAEDNPSARAGIYIETNAVMKGREVILELFIPRYKDMYADLEKTHGNWAESVFKIIVVSDIMYELAHARGYDEIRAHALVCKNVFAPIVEIHHIPLPKVEQEYYDAWVRAERNESSPEWTAFVSKKYPVIPPKHQISYEPSHEY